MKHQAFKGLDGGLEQGQLKPPYDMDEVRHLNVHLTLVAMPCPIITPQTLEVVGVLRSLGLDYRVHGGPGQINYGQLFQASVNHRFLLHGVTVAFKRRVNAAESLPHRPVQRRREGGAEGVAHHGQG